MTRTLSVLHPPAQSSQRNGKDRCCNRCEVCGNKRQQLTEKLCRSAARTPRCGTTHTLVFLPHARLFCGDVGAVVTFGAAGADGGCECEVHSDYLGIFFCGQVRLNQAGGSHLIVLHSHVQLFLRNGAFVYLETFFCFFFFFDLIPHLLSVSIYMYSFRTKRCDRCVRRPRVDLMML